MGRAAIDDPARSECLDCGLPQFLHVVEVASAPLVRQLGSGAEADAERRRQGPGAKPLLLSAAVDERCRLLALAHPQRPDTLWTVDLVRGNGDHVRSAAQLDPAQCL